MTPEAQKKENRLKLIEFMVDHAAEAIVLIGRDGKIRYANHKAATSLRFTDEELPDKSVFELDQTLTQDRLEELWAHTKEHKVVTLESMQIRKDGSIIPTEVTVNFLTYRNEDLLVGFVKDISARKEAEYLKQIGFEIFNTVNRSTSLSHLFLDIRNMMSKIIDTSTLMLTIRNPKSGQNSAFYVRNGEVVAEKVEVENSLIGWLFDSGKPVRLQESDIRKLQDEKLVKKTSSPAKCWLGIPLHFGEEVIGVISLENFEDEHAFSDQHLRTLDYISSQISLAIQRKQSEEALKVSEQSLRESNVSKDKFFSIIAHDLRGPFNAIIGFSELLHTELDSFNEMERRTMIKNIHEASVSTFKLLENLLEWSRIQTGRTKPNPENIDLSTIVNNSLSFLKHLAEKKKIKLFSGIHFGTIAYCDENMITTVIRNLISNAIKFTNPMGDVRIWATEKEKVIEIVVADNGVGIPPENQQKLFRLDESVKTRGTSGEQGTGLGLILCHEFIELNGGRILVESTPGKGSQFKFTLPKFNF
ncbi:MAG: PAS domain-containing sensor histidine kinase [bacterium]